MDAFLVSAGFPQFENQKHALVGMFLVFAGSLSLPLMQTTKTHLCGRIFVVRRLSSTRKAETRPHGRVSAFCWLPSFPHHANIPHPFPTYHSDWILLGTARNLIRIAQNRSELLRTARFQLVPIGTSGA